MKTKIFLIIASIYFLNGCSDNSTPAGLNDLKRPVVLVSKSEEGSVLLRGADGELVCYSSTYFLAQTLKNVAIGDTIAK